MAGFGNVLAARSALGLPNPEQAPPPGLPAFTAEPGDPSLGAAPGLPSPAPPPPVNRVGEIPAPLPTIEANQTVDLGSTAPVELNIRQPDKAGSAGAVRGAEQGVKGAQAAQAGALRTGAEVEGQAAVEKAGEAEKFGQNLAAEGQRLQSQQDNAHLAAEATRAKLKETDAYLEKHGEYEDRRTVGQKARGVLSVIIGAFGAGMSSAWGGTNENIGLTLVQKAMEADRASQDRAQGEAGKRRARLEGDLTKQLGSEQAAQAALQLNDMNRYKQALTSIDLKTIPDAARAEVEKTIAGLDMQIQQGSLQFQQALNQQEAKLANDRKVANIAQGGATLRQREQIKFEGEQKEADRQKDLILGQARIEAKKGETPQVGDEVPGGARIAKPDVYAQATNEVKTKFVERQQVRAAVLPLIQEYQDALAERKNYGLGANHLVPGDWGPVEQKLAQLEKQIGSALTAGKGAWDNGLQRLADDFLEGSTWTREGIGANLQIHKANLALASRADAENLGLRPLDSADQKAIDAKKAAQASGRPSGNQ